MNTCYINTKNKRVLYGFIMPKHYIHGIFNSEYYITNGNIRGGKMLMYFLNDNGWFSKSMDIKQPLPDMVNKKYGAIIASKNAQYKESRQAALDKQADLNKPFGSQYGLRKTTPYNGAAIDAKFQAFRAGKRERSAGLNAI